jgi:hypothetical protein
MSSDSGNKTGFQQVRSGSGNLADSVLSFGCVAGDARVGGHVVSTLGYPIDSRPSASTTACSRFVIEALFGP